ncbi:Ig-like domain-containing protein [Acetivibrio ethanolgignens]|uniref:BIG2 domain-containing protein n=1 Tax=Acetivibrio ethanolgignens TaxID=290052 RepID=A0A0V8QEU2_9FIRM|nr:Ig-like domain-containing protein [Acetivibrio ethanolgignens]KSV59109.1 hypothetical protein ASU35_01990 [Acetivibrio ethanolgignens]
MKKVSFIIAKCLFMLSMGLLLTGFLPLPNTFFLSNNIAVAKASEVGDDDDKASSLRLNVNAFSLIIEDSYTLRLRNLEEGQKVTYKAEDSDIVSIKKVSNKEAEITGDTVGTTTIIVTVKQAGKTVRTLKCKVKVGPPAQSVRFGESEVTVKAGEKTTLKAKLTPGTTVETGRYKSEDTEIATVTSQGTVTALKPGEVKITITIANGATDTCTVKVIE